MNILLADDDEMIQTVVTSLLQKLGHGVRVASGGQEALTQMEEELPELVVLDLYMDDMSGLDVLSEIRQREDWAGLPVLMMSSEHDDSSIGVAMEFGANDYLIKPVDANTLKEKLAAYTPAPEPDASESAAPNEEPGPEAADPYALPAGHRLGPYELRQWVDDRQVYEALDPRLDRLVEVRVGPDAPREAATMARLSHPNVLAVFDVGEGPTPFLVRERVEGQALMLLGGASTTQALHWTRDLLQAVAALHARGMAHGNLSPAAVLVSTEGHLKLADFRASRAPAAFTAPEVAAGEEGGPSADLYAVAAILQFLLTNDASLTSPVSDEALRELCSRGLSPTPAERFGSAKEFRKELGPRLSKALRQR